MGHFLYCADDAPFIHHILGFFTHMQACGDCQKRGNEGEGKDQIEYLFQALNQIALEEIPSHDYAAACAFCERWFQIHELLMLVDLGLGGEADGTVQ